MDITLARTFLEIVASGSFVVAGERLHVTQTAVSSRIRSLETQLGRRLFVRNKAGARLTPAGERFRKFAMTLVQVWEHARHQVALPAGRSEIVGVGAELSLWTPFMANWLIWMHRQCKDIALRVDVDLPARLLDGIQNGSLDVAVVYKPPSRPELVSELLSDEKLVMVTTARDGRFDAESYVHVDWGTSFKTNIESAFPELALPNMTISLGPLALSYLLSVGGSGYFRQRAVQQYIDDGKLNLVKGAPPFSYSVHAVYSSKADRGALDRVRKGLRVCSNASDERRSARPHSRGRSAGTRRV